MFTKRSLLSVDYGFLYICEIFEDIKMQGMHINMQKYIKHSKQYLL